MILRRQWQRSVSLDTTPLRRWRNVAARARRSGSPNVQPKEVPTADKLTWRSPLEVVKYPDPRLRAVNARIGVFDESLRALAAEMMELMYQDDGVGLAAPQVGVNVRLMVFNETGVKGQGQEMVLANPEIVQRSKRLVTEREGCLSFPGILADVDRAFAIRVRAQDASGAPLEMELQDWPAIIFQHEFDHLNGVLFHDRMRREWLDKVRPQLVDLEEAFLMAHPGVPVQRVPPPKPAKIKKGFGS